jgi:hypothetical protein
MRDLLYMFIGISLLMATPEHHGYGTCPACILAVGLIGWSLGAFIFQDDAAFEQD